MFTDDVLDRYYANVNMADASISASVECIKAFYLALEEIREERPDARISELFEY